MNQRKKFLRSNSIRTELVPNDDITVLSSLIKLKCWDLLTTLIREKPFLAKEFLSIHEHGKYISRLPIHEVCRNKPPLSLVEELVSAYPESLRLQDKCNGSLPIHFGCRCGASTEVIFYLLKHYPNSANMEDRYGCTPMAMNRRSSCKHKEEIAQLFLNQRDHTKDHKRAQTHATVA